MGASLCKFDTTLIQELGISSQSLREALPNHHYKIGMVIHIDIREVVNPFRSSWSRIHNTAGKKKKKKSLMQNSLVLSHYLL